MSRPYFVARLTGREINGSGYSCEGEQIATIIACIAPILVECIWFAADIEQIDGPHLFPNSLTIPALIGSTAQTLEWLRQVPQFVWGSFLAVEADHLPATWPAVASEDNPFHDIGEALVEIVAFDSSEMHAYAMIEEYLEPLEDRFGTKIQTPADEPWASMLDAETPEWRRRAIADFPELGMFRRDLNYSPYELFYHDLLSMVRSMRERTDPALLTRIFDYAAWCHVEQTEDLANAAGLSFYEHLFDDRKDWETVLPYLSPVVVRDCWSLWEARWRLWESRSSAAEVRWLREKLTQLR